MELKRILARDTRAANEKAVALYGPDVLVISSSKVRGQTELIVAVDVAPLDAETAVAETFVPTVCIFLRIAIQGMYYRSISLNNSRDCRLLIETDCG